VIKIFLFACLLFCQAATALAQTHYSWLPKGALVLETRQLNSTRQPNRLLVLWMINPKKQPDNYKSDDIYTCPDESRGSYFSGPTRVSLVDSTTNELINTIKIAEDESAENDLFDLPYAIRKGYYYEVPGRAPATVEVKPTIMALKDYNGDGRVAEFALFDAQACMGLSTALIGYSEDQDHVIQYPVELVVIENGKRTKTTNFWPDYLLKEQPVQPGHWKYEIDYRGRGGTLDQWDVRYNATKEVFEGTLIVVNDEP
jgi:hypothetical protein